MQANATIDQIRERFERHYAGRDLSRTSYGAYADPRVDDMWLAWIGGWAAAEGDEMRSALLRAVLDAEAVPDFKRMSWETYHAIAKLCGIAERAAERHDDPVLALAVKFVYDAERTEVDAKRAAEAV